MINETDIRTSQDNMSEAMQLIREAQHRECAIQATNGSREWIAPISHIIPDMAVLYNQEGFSRFIDWSAAERRLTHATSYSLVDLEAIPDE